MAENVAATAVRAAGPIEMPYISRSSGGSVANASRDTPRRTGRQSASLGGSLNSCATLRAYSVAWRIPLSMTPCM